MWIKGFLLSCVFILIGCEAAPCTEDEQITLEADLQQAYDSWKYHLNYLDRSVVFSDSEFLKCRLRDLHVCAGTDTSIIARIDSAIWYFTHDPVTTEHMERGDMLVHKVEEFMAEVFNAH